METKKSDDNDLSNIVERVLSGMAQKCKEQEKKEQNVSHVKPQNEQVLK